MAYFLRSHATTSFRVQLLQTGGACYETAFAPSDVSRHEYGTLDAFFQAKH